MDKRLIQAYDNMTMPENCSQRIETLLQQSPMEKTHGDMVISRPNKRAQAWGLASALVCLTLVLSLGGVMLWLILQGQWQPKPSEFSFAQPSATEAVPESIPRELIYGTPYQEEDLEFLKTMCQVMPSWDGYATLDDVFWTEFVVRILNEWEYALEGDELGSQVLTPAGTGMLIRQQNKVYMTRAAIAEFVQKTMGCDLPDFVPSGEYASMISLSADIFTVDVTEMNRYQYELQNWDKDNDQAQVTFGIYADPVQPSVGQVTFQLWEAETDRGFIITGRPTKFRMTRMESPEIEETAWAFAEALFSEDVVAMQETMTHRENWLTALNPVVQGMYSREKEPIVYQIQEVRVFHADIGGDSVLAFVDYSYQGEPILGRSLILTMVRTEEGWKVRTWDEGNPESYDPDREEIYDVAQTVAWYYLQGYVEWMRDYLVSDQYQPPVYEGKPEGPQIRKIEIEFDPQVTNEAGDMMAWVFVEVKASEKDLNTTALYLDFVKVQGAWKVERIGEG